MGLTLILDASVLSIVGLMVARALQRTLSRSVSKHPIDLAENLRLLRWRHQRSVDAIANDRDDFIATQ
jgi:hypothetical protein